MTSPDQPHFYLSRQGRAHGPLSWEEIRSYLAYGSVSPGEMLSMDGRKDWRSLDEWREVVEGPVSSDDEAQGFSRKAARFMAALWQALKPAEAKDGLPRRRAVRFREWEHVPENQRSTKVLSDILTGFLFFPPRLWSASSRVFSQHIFRKSSDDAGFLKIWPPVAETLCSTLILVNALWWTVLLFLLKQHAFPMFREAMLALHESMKS